MKYEEVKSFTERKRRAITYADKIAGSNVTRWGEFWDDQENRDDVMTQRTAILINHTESIDRVTMTAKEEMWYRRGLDALPNLWKQCQAQKKKK